MFSGTKIRFSSNSGKFAPKRTTLSVNYAQNLFKIPLAFFCRFHSIPTELFFAILNPKSSILNSGKVFLYIVLSISYYRRDLVYHSLSRCQCGLLLFIVFKFILNTVLYKEQ